MNRIQELVLFVVLIKEGRRFTFLYEPGLAGLEELIEALHEVAEDKDIPFTEADAKLLAKRAWEVHEEDKKKGFNAEQCLRR